MPAPTSADAAAPSGPPPTVSIVVPCYNAARFIAGTLDSALAQTYRDYEIVLVNDGSPDTPALEEAIAPYRDCLRYVRQENAGPSAARNHGIREARGRYIAFLDSDDRLDPEYLAVQTAALEADPTLDVVYPDALLFGDHPHAGRRFMEVCPSEGPVSFESLVTQRCQVFVGVLARREALERAGLFDVDMRSSEDFDLWVRVLLSGGRIGYHRRVLVHFRKHQGSLSSDPVWMAQNAVRAYEKARSLAVTAEQRRLLTARLADFRATLDLEQGKRALLEARHAQARLHFEAANAHLRSGKLWLVTAALRIAPDLVRRAYARWRQPASAPARVHVDAGQPA